jgi:hypothetical protein
VLLRAEELLEADVLLGAEVETLWRRVEHEQRLTMYF